MKDNHSTGGHRGRLIGRITLILINVAVGLSMLTAAFAGTIDAETFPVVAIAGMTFPMWVPLMVIVTVADAIWMRKAVIFSAVVFGLSLPMVVRLFPLNIPRGPVPERLAAESWTLMTYNVAEFLDFSEKPYSAPHPTVEYIIEKNPDIVVLQEADFLCPLESHHITETQIDTLRNRYGFISIGSDITMLSRFPAERMKELDDLIIDEKSPMMRRAGFFKVDIHGHRVLIIGVHLQSIGLTDDDKALYNEITRGKGLSEKSEISAVKYDLVDKLARANVARARQVDRVTAIIDSLGIENVVVTGDFNDVPGCMAYRVLERKGFRAVYPEVGLGYRMTYNQKRFYFMIDHIFIRGNYRPWSIERGSNVTSDHYPLTVTFVER